MAKAKVFIVEDEVLIADEVSISLTELGYHVCGIAAKGEVALEKIKKLQPEVVVCDIRLAGAIDGIEVADYVRNHFGLPVVYLTAHADIATLERAKVTQPYGYVIKPASDLELQTALELALYRHRAEKGEIAPIEEDISEVEESSIDDLALAEIYNVLRAIPSLAKANDNLLYNISKRSCIKTYKSGQSLVFEGDEDVDGFLVFSGRVAMIKTSVSGRELIVELLPPGNTLGLVASVAWRPYPIRVEAQNESKVIWVPRNCVSELLEKHSEFNSYVMNDLFARLRGAHSISRSLAHDRVEVRVASALLALIPEYGCEKASQDSAEIYMTRQELAHCTGTSLETAVRVTKEMERDGALDLSKRGRIKIVVPEHLRTLIEKAT